MAIEWAALTNVPIYSWMPPKLEDAISGKMLKTIGAVLKLRERATALENELKPWRVEPGETDRRPFLSTALQALEREAEARDQLALLWTAAVEAARSAKGQAEKGLRDVEQKLRDGLGLRPDDFLSPHVKQTFPEWWIAHHAVSDAPPESQFDGYVRDNDHAARRLPSELELFRKLLAADPERVRNFIANRDRRTEQERDRTETEEKRLAAIAAERSKVDALLA